MRIRLQFGNASGVRESRRARSAPGMNNAYRTGCPSIDHGPIPLQKKYSLHVINIVSLLTFSQQKIDDTLNRISSETYSLFQLNVNNAKRKPRKIYEM